MSRYITVKRVTPLSISGMCLYWAGSEPRAGSPPGEYRISMVPEAVHSCVSDYVSLGIHTSQWSHKIFIPSEAEHP